MNIKESKFVSNEAELIAKQLVEKKCSIDSVDPSMHQMLLVPLSVYRNQAIFLNQNKRKNFIDGIIAKLDLTSLNTNPRPDKKNKKVIHQSSALVKTNRNHVKVTFEERKYINQIIDALLTDSEIDTIDTKFIPKMLIVLRERKQKSSVNKDFKNMKQIQKLITMLEKMKSDRDKTDLSKKLIDDYEKAFDKINKINQAYKSQIDIMHSQKEDAIQKVIEINTIEANEYKEEKESLENGKGFRPSQSLCELIRKSKYAKDYEEHRYFQKQIEEMENAEMFDYLTRSDRLLKIKKERLQKVFRNREKLLEEQWKTKFQKLENQYNGEISQEKIQLNSIRQKMKDIGINPPLLEKCETNLFISVKNNIYKNENQEVITNHSLIHSNNENKDGNIDSHKANPIEQNDAINGLNDDDFLLCLDFFHIDSSSSSEDNEHQMDSDVNSVINNPVKTTPQKRNNHDLTLLFGDIPIQQTRSPNSDSGSDLIIFSPDKDDTEVPFYTDDDLNQSIITIKATHETSPIYHNERYQ